MGSRAGAGSGWYALLKPANDSAEARRERQRVADRTSMLAASLAPTQSRSLDAVVVLPDTPLEGAKRLAETLRRELADMLIDWNGETLRITASFGVTTSPADETEGQAIVGRADQAMYRAKEQGRDCVRLLTETAVA